MNAIEAKGILSLYRNLSFIDKLHIYIRLRRLPFEIVEKYVARKGNILDFGCGHGFFSLYLSKKSRNRNIVGVDISKEKIKIASDSKHSESVSFNCDPDSISFLNKKFNYSCIVILSVLYLLDRKSQQDVVKRASESLKCGGRLLIIEPDASLKLKTFYEIIRESIMLKFLKRTKGTSLTYNTKQWWVENLRKYFRKVECFSLGNRKHHLLYVCVK